MLTTLTRFRAVTIDVDGELHVADWPAGEEGVYRHLRETIGGNLEVVRLADGLDMWVHDEGLSSHQINPVASYLAAQFGYDHQPYFGPAAFTGGADEDGATRPLGHLMQAAVTAHARRASLL
ncbi:DUF3846 domain-containing protein [Isoptericola sp. NPDC056578]|uniref:DUF3846 domain-containing protein n=1 Tax=Isoptericola sp. NPDC056578 TaxID=3345870 RepID=UPI0036C54EED